MININHCCCLSFYLTKHSFNTNSNSLNETDPSLLWSKKIRMDLHSSSVTEESIRFNSLPNSTASNSWLADLSYLNEKIQLPY